ncbi:hypothetical protein GOP47_0021064 [Adiantum capillus-veneris]|uniref:AAA+ ATPase domain-containing protein n=1 Tax=Adiantum capillus-veneris TaxID=13818 RepID=A0A9D4UBY8_ADICA|nr:hypothetical protein GOP47_0021064 [Adiantum capillus-veneris]
MKPTEVLAYLGSLVGMITVAQTMLHTVLPPPLRHLLQRFFDKLKEHFTRYHYVDIPENDESCLSNELYGAVKLHLSANARSYAPKAKRVKLCRTLNSSEITWSPARSQQVPMSFQGARVWWEHHIIRPQTSDPRSPWRSFREEEVEDRRKYTLRVHKCHKERIITPYMEHILKQAQEIKLSNRQRHLYTNAKGGSSYYDLYRSTWDHVPFKHPSTFDTLAMDPQRKSQIQADLKSYMDGQEFYKKTGRAWKRGYLLHGPPGTGKSSLIAAMANFLCYDVYDLELTHVRSNGDLRKMLLKTTSKSIIVIEDIDCSLDLASSRAKKSSSPSSPSSSASRRTYEGRGDEKDETLPPSSMTLSGLLNFTDGLWSCCGEERIFVFTTNHVENLDPALLRPGRMDMHILMSYCTYAAFKILVMNYLDMDDHALLPKVEGIIEDAHVTPAEVSEVLMRNRDDAERAMEELMVALEVAKARPWPPLPVKKAGAEEAVDGAGAGEVEEVKEAVEVEKKSRSGEKERCPFCPCGKKGRDREKHEEIKVEKKEEKDVCICIDKGEVTQSKPNEGSCIKGGDNNQGVG